jgi:hypothetical protein
LINRKPMTRCVSTPSSTASRVSRIQLLNIIFPRNWPVSKGFQTIAATIVDYSKKHLEDSTRAFEQLVGAKSFEQAWEIQSQYAKKAFDAYVAQASKIGEMYVDIARSAYQPVEQAAAKTARKVA